MDIAQEAPTDQALEGLLTPGDLRALGIQVTPGDEAALLARRGTGELDRARNIRAQEELDRTVPVLGDRVNQIRGEQQDGLTRAVARELGLEGQEALTDSAVGRALNNLGQQFDRVADELGPAPIPDRAAFTESLEEIRDLAPADLEARANQWIETIQKSVDQSGGYLTPDTFQRMRTRLGKEIQAAGRAGDMGRVTTAGDMLDLLENTIQEGAPTALRQEIRELRRQYRIAKTLTKPGVIQRGDGRGVNAASFAQNWRRAGGDRFYRGAENDQIGRLAETVAFLTTRVAPSSGTGERVLNALKRRAVSAGTFGAL